MALGETIELTSPMKLGSTNVAIIWGSGAPDGDSSPQSDAVKGSLYIRTNATDDQSPLYIKVDESSADDDWVQVFVDKSEAAFSLEEALTLSTDKKLYFRDTGIYLYSNSDGYLRLVADTSVNVGDGTNMVQIASDGELTLAGRAFINPTSRFEIFDDFVYQTLTEADTPWILNSGSDDLAVDPAVSAAERGVVVVTTGDGDGSTAADAAQLVCAIPVQADSGGLIFEARLHINTAITNVAINVGLTDATGLEEPFTIGGSDTITSTASDAVCFVYDTGADTDEWFMCAVDSDTDDSGNATTGTAPTADTYQIFRIEVDSDGATIRFYIDGTLEGTLSGDAGVSPDVNLYATVIACGDGTASKTVDVDYVYVGHTR